MRVSDPSTGEEFELVYDDEVQKDILDVSHRFRCDHTIKTLVRALNAGGATTYRYQCNRCGELTGNAISHREVRGNIPDADITANKLWNENYRSERQRIFLEHARRQRNRDSHFWIRYDEYLRSPEWARPRGQSVSKS